MKKFLTFLGKLSKICAYFYQFGFFSLFGFEPHIMNKSEPACDCFSLECIEFSFFPQDRKYMPLQN